MRSNVLVAVCFALLAVLYLHGLGDAGVLGPDEPRYASIGREMAERGDWITPHLWGEPWFEKPALLYWLVGGAYAAGFGDDVAPRLGVALLSLLFLAFFYFELRRAHGARPAALATGMLATCAGWFAFSQVGVTDVPLSATFCASMLLARRWTAGDGGRGVVVLSGALLGAAMLAKGLVPVVLAAPLVWFARRRFGNLLLYAASALVVAAPWYIACYAVNGWPFIQEFFLEHHFGRFASDALKHEQPFWFYVPVVIAGLFPWSPLLALLARRAPWRREALLLGVAAFGFVFLSASVNKLPGYVLPLVPLVFAALAPQLERVPRWALAVSALLLGFVPLVGHVLPAALRDGLSRAPIPAADLAWFVPAAAVAWFASKRGPAILVVAAYVAILGLHVAVMPALDREVSVRSLPRPACLPEGTRRHVAYGHNFYARRALPACSGQHTW